MLYSTNVKPWEERSNWGSFISLTPQLLKNSRLVDFAILLWTER